MQRISLLSSKMKSVFLILLLLVTACDNSNEWVCKSGSNAKGEPIQYSENINTGEIGSYSKCKK